MGHVETNKREVKCNAGDVPKIDIPPLQCAQPRILQLLVAPCRGEGRPLVRGNLRAARSGRREIEYRAIGVEYAGANARKPAHRYVPRVGEFFSITKLIPTRRASRSRRTKGAL